MPFILDSKHYAASRFGQIAAGAVEATQRQQAIDLQRKQLEQRATEAGARDERAQESLAIARDRNSVARERLALDQGRDDALTKLSALARGGGGPHPTSMMGLGIQEFQERFGDQPGAMEALEAADPRDRDPFLRGLGGDRKARLEMEDLDEVRAMGEALDAKSGGEGRAQMVTPGNRNSMRKQFIEENNELNVRARSDRRAQKQLQQVEGILGIIGGSADEDSMIKHVQEYEDDAATKALTDDEHRLFFKRALRMLDPEAEAEAQQLLQQQQVLMQGMQEIARRAPELVRQVFDPRGGGAPKEPEALPEVKPTGASGLAEKLGVGGRQVSKMHQSLVDWANEPEVRKRLFGDGSLKAEKLGREAILKEAQRRGIKVQSWADFLGMGVYQEEDDDVLQRAVHGGLIKNDGPDIFQYQ